MNLQNNAKNGGFCERVFHLSAKKTNVRTEFLGALTTFLTIVYVIAVNPSVLSASGMDAKAVFWATVVSTVIATLAVGVYGNFPFVMAPSMGLNAYFAYTVCGDMGLTWQQGLACVFTSGMLFVVLGFFKIQQKIVDDLPDVIKHSVGAGVGFFIALIGLKNAGLVIANPDTMVTLGNLGDPGTLLALAGIVLTAILVIKKVPGNILISILIITVIGIFVKNPATGEPYTILPESLIALDNPVEALAPTFGKLSFAGLFEGSYKEIIGVIFVMISFFFVDLFGSVGVLLGLADSADMVDENGNVPGAGKALTVSAAGAAVGAIFGTSTITICGAESATGIAAGGRTGLTAWFIALLFALTLIFSPVFLMIPTQATASALVMVGVYMIEPLCHLDLSDLTVAIPAFFTIAMMPFTYNLAYGILFGLLAYTLTTVASKKTKEITPTVWALTLLFLVYFIMDIFI